MNDTTARDARLAALLRKAANELDPALCAKKPAARVKTSAKAKAAKAQKSEEFVAWMRETAPARAARKETNAVLAARLRAAGINPSGAAWDVAKAGGSLKAIRAAAK